MTYHADPTFWEVARRESRDCAGCIYYEIVCNVKICHKDKWIKAIKMKRCDEYKREIK